VGRTDCPPVAVEHGDEQLAALLREGSTQVSVHHAPGATVDDDVLHPADLADHDGEGLALRAVVLAPVRGVSVATYRAYELVPRVLECALKSNSDASARSTNASVRPRKMRA
jgi:hypothetical protein